MLIICCLPVSTSVSGDGASAVGGPPSLGTHEVDLLLREKVVLGKEERNAIPVLGRAAESCPMAVSHRESQQGVGTVGGWRVWEAGDSRSLADGHESAPPGRGSGVSVAADWPVAPESARRVRSCWRRKRVTSLVWKQSQREKMW